MNDVRFWLNFANAIVPQSNVLRFSALLVCNYQPGHAPLSNTLGSPESPLLARLMCNNFATAYYLRMKLVKNYRLRRT